MREGKIEPIDTSLVDNTQEENEKESRGGQNDGTDATPITAVPVFPAP